MSCKSALYTVGGGTTVNVGGVIPLGAIIRRFGRNINLSGDGIMIAGDGYYDVVASITLAPTVAGEVTVSLYEDGVPLIGAGASDTVATAGDLVNLNVVGMARLRCCDDVSSLTLVLTGEDTITSADIVNIAVKVEKI